MGEITGEGMAFLRANCSALIAENLNRLAGADRSYIGHATLEAGEATSWTAPPDDAGVMVTMPFGVALAVLGGLVMQQQVGEAATEMVKAVLDPDGRSAWHDALRFDTERRLRRRWPRLAAAIHRLGDAVTQGSFPYFGG